jgi:hypothetical protein
MFLALLVYLFHVRDACLRCYLDELGDLESRPTQATEPCLPCRFIAAEFRRQLLDGVSLHTSIPLSRKRRSPIAYQVVKFVQELRLPQVWGKGSGLRKVLHVLYDIDPTENDIVESRAGM